MKAMLNLILAVFKVLSSISLNLASRFAFFLFCRPMNRTIRKREKILYREAKHIVLDGQQAPLHTYELGKPDGKLVFLVHGWESNAGSMYRIATDLAAKGYRVLSLDLPAHGQSTVRSTNLLYAADALLELIRSVNPTRPFSIVSHSFGSLVTAYALSQESWELEHVVFLTAPSGVAQLTTEYQKMVPFDDRVLRGFQNKIEDLLNTSLIDLDVSKLMQGASYESFTMIHDRHDKILPYENAVAIADSLPNSALIPLEHVGHYRMLWEDEVVEGVVDAVSGPAQVFIPSPAFAEAV